MTSAERRAGFGWVIAFMLFCAANQYARMQWNTGVRYLMPLVPFLFLAACDGLGRLPGALMGVVIGACTLHEWVICLARTCDIRSDWAALLDHGPRLPWLSVLAATPTGRDLVTHPGALSIAILGVLCAALAPWWWRARPLSPTSASARRQRVHATPA